MLRLGFGFAEAGTVTPQPQPGNPRPRLFRLDADEAVINRLGFNSDGRRRGAARLAARARRGRHRRHQYRRQQGFGRPRRRLRGAASRRSRRMSSFLTVNVSSPNTPGLRDLQQAKALDDLLARVIEARERVADGTARRPLLLKIAPDLTLGDLDDVVGVARAPPHRRHDRRQHHREPPAEPARPRARRRSRAGSRAGRCSRSPPACWPRPMCGSKARSR